MAGENAKTLSPHLPHTPLHSRAQIIHVVRRGSDVTASIRDRANRFPEQFGRQQNPEYAVKLWNRSVRTALKDAKRGRALVIMYEDFVADHERMVRMIGAQLHLKERQQKTETATRIIGETERWKSNSSEEIRLATSKFTEVFDPDTRALILRKLDMRAYNALAPLALSVPDNPIAEKTFKLRRHYDLCLQVELFVLRRPPPLRH